MTLRHHPSARLACCLAIGCLAAAPALLAQPGQATMQVAETPKATVLPAKKPVLQKKPDRPRECKPGEPAPECAKASAEALRLILEIADNCPDCVAKVQGSLQLQTSARPVRPQDFCEGVERIARMERMRVKCTPQAQSDPALR